MDHWLDCGVRGLRFFLATQSKEGCKGSVEFNGPLRPVNQSPCSPGHFGLVANRAFRVQVQVSGSGSWVLGLAIEVPKSVITATLD